MLGMRHFDVQLIGGMVLNDGKIAEMRTGEGKTLVATLAAYLNALARQGRARSHGERLPGPPRRRVDGQDLSFLGLSVGVINSSGGMGPDATSYLYDPEYEPPTGRATGTCAR